MQELMTSNNYRFLLDLNPNKKEKELCSEKIKSIIDLNLDSYFVVNAEVWKDKKGKENSIVVLQSKYKKDNEPIITIFSWDNFKKELTYDLNIKIIKKGFDYEKIPELLVENKKKIRDLLNENFKILNINILNPNVVKIKDNFFPKIYTETEKQKIDNQNSLKKFESKLNFFNIKDEEREWRLSRFKKANELEKSNMLSTSLTIDITKQLNIEEFLKAIKEFEKVK